MERSAPRVAARLAGSLLVLATILGACTAGGDQSAPPGSPGPPNATGNRPYRPTPVPAPTFATWVVRRGDTLVGLALRFETTPESLAYWNRVAYPSLDPDSPTYDPDRIEVGWRLAYLAGTVVDPENLPPGAGESPAPTASPDARPFPTLPADGSALLVRAGPADSTGVALTFELGNRTDASEAVVEWLVAQRVPATIFVAGALAVSGEPAVDDALQRIGAATSITLGSLGWDDTDGSVLSPGEVVDGLRRAEAAIGAATDRTTVPLYRPAGGAATPAVLAATGRAGWRWAIGWDVDPADGVAPAAGGPAAAGIVARVRASAHGGSIVRLRADGWNTLAALPGIVDGLAADGRPVVPLGDLLGPSFAP